MNIILLGCGILLMAAGPEARPQGQAFSATIEKLTGEADIKRPAAEDWESAKTGMELAEGAQISTGFDSEMVLLLTGGHRVTLQSLTQIELTRLLRSEKAVETAIRLDIGSMKGKVEKEAVPVSFEVRSPIVTASVKGTEWTLAYTSDFGFNANVMQGLLSLNTAQEGNVSVAAGLTASTTVGSAFQPGGPVSGSVRRDFEALAADSGVSLHDVASQVDAKSTLSAPPAQYAEFSLSDPGVTTSVMSLRTILANTADIQAAAQSQDVFVL